MGLAAFAGVMLLGTLKGIIVAIIVSMVMLAYQAPDPPVYVLGRKPGTNVFRPLSQGASRGRDLPRFTSDSPRWPVFFANAEHIGQKIKPLVEASGPKAIAVDLSGVPDLEYTALKLLRAGPENAANTGSVGVARGTESPSAKRCSTLSLGDTLGRDGMCFNVETAVAKYQELHPPLGAINT